MSTVEVEQSSPVAPSHQRLATDGVELTGFRPAPRRTSLAAIINVDDDTSGAERYSRPSRRGQSSFSISMDDRPSAPVAASSLIIDIEDPDNGGTRENRRTNNGAQHRPIVVLDSDEEQGQPSGSTGLSFRRRHGGVRRRGGGSSSSSFRIFSPSPPPPQRHHVPPVPFLPPLIAEPVPFAILPPPVNNIQPRNRLPFDQPAQPINNNIPHGNNNNANGIQLGGGLFSQGNGAIRRHGPRAQVHFQPRRSEIFEEFFQGSDDHQPLQRASRFFGRFFASYLFEDVNRPSNQNRPNPPPGRPRVNAGGIPDQLHDAGQDMDVFNWVEIGGRGGNALPPNVGFFGLPPPVNLGAWARRDLALGLGPDYDRRMTHPERAGPGWTYDFGVEQEEGKPKVDGSEILVCAKCLDPLLANADGMVDVNEKEKRGRRVWGLRCGHILDGKCVGTLMMPGRERDLLEKGTDFEHNSKGKDREADPEHAGEKDVDGSVTSVDIKGKGKNSAAPIRAPTPPPLDDKEKSSTPYNEREANLPQEDTSIRSRLRSRVNPISSAVTSPRRSARHLAAAHGRGGLSSTRRRGTKRKRAANVVAEAVEERFEWMCPVSGCGRMHVSVKVGGLWKMEADNGAVAIFV